MNGEPAEAGDTALPKHPTLIKRADAASANAQRLLDWWSASAMTSAAPAQGDPAIAALEQEVQTLQQRLVETGARATEAIDAAYARGQAEAIDDRKTADLAALSALHAGIEGAAQLFEERLQELEALALVISESALEQVFGERGYAQDTITRAIAAQIAVLRRDTIVRVLVSGADFCDPDALKTLSETLGGRLRIESDSELAAGACRIELKLGDIEISLPLHWQNLQMLLRQLAEPAR